MGQSHSSRFTSQAQNEALLKNEREESEKSYQTSAFESLSVSFHCLLINAGTGVRGIPECSVYALLAHTFSLYRVHLSSFHVWL